MGKTPTFLQYVVGCCGCGTGFSPPDDPASENATQTPTPDGVAMQHTGRASVHTPQSLSTEQVSAGSASTAVGTIADSSRTVRAIVIALFQFFIVFSLLSYSSEAFSPDHDPHAHKEHKG